MTGEYLVLYEDIGGELKASIQKGKKATVGWLKVIIDNNLSKNHIAVYPPGTWEDEILKK